jgi:hypothetical protein
LPSAEVDQLCAMQRRGSLEQTTLDRVRERTFPLGTQKPEQPRAPTVPGLRT